MVKLAIIGAGGRMGAQLFSCAAEFPRLVVSGAVDRPGSAAVGQDLGKLAGLEAAGIIVVDSLDRALAGADVAVDFSDASSTAANIRGCASRGVPLLVGTTGLGPEVAAAAAAAVSQIPLIIAANTSLGVTLLTELVRRVARVLPAEFDIEIVEAHHRDKKDAPSGTALALGKAAAEGRAQDLAAVAKIGRAGVAPRAAGEIGFAVVRGGDIIGDHTVLFAGSAERITLSHQATDRAIFARGALGAALWLAGRQPGRFSMSDVININQ